MKNHTVILAAVLASTPVVLSHPQQEVLNVGEYPSRLLQTVPILNHGHDALDRLRNIFDSGGESFNSTGGAAESSLFVPADRDSTFPFDSSSTGYTSPPEFVKNMYLGNGDSKPWISNTPARLAADFPWMVALLGDKELTPDPKANEPVKVKTNPRWRWADYWRPLNLYKVFLSRKAAQTSGNGLVIDEILKALSSGDLSTALFPNDVKSLLLANEKAITSSTKPWVGAPAKSRPTQYPTFDNVKVTHAAGTSGAAFKQANPVGPMSLESTFILATQLAGINWKTLRAKLKPEHLAAGVYWAGAITPEKKDDQRIQERRKSFAERVMGYVSRPNTPSSGSPDSGFYLVLDVDPDKDGFSDPTKNVFVFAAHLIDQHSRVYVKNTNSLRNLGYATPYLPGKGNPPQIPSSNKGDDVRFYAHAHAGVMQYSTWMNWIGQTITPGKKGEKMPNYIQIGEMHLYFLLEDENDIWPRSTWIKRNP
ncbi:hypothetical protein BC629DRAFT_589483 [Irpex lacteus]|nr:hypothetical protein BC629DRAFT_589483 [Irpex lacteus]